MTATVQANLDWSDEADLASKVRAATSVRHRDAHLRQQPLVMDARAPTWTSATGVARDRNDARCGLLEQMLQGPAGLSRYVDGPSTSPCWLFATGANTATPASDFRSWLDYGRLSSGEKMQQPLCTGSTTSSDAVPGSARQARAGSPWRSTWCRSLDDRAPGPAGWAFSTTLGSRSAAELTRRWSSPICCKFRPRWRAMRCARRARGGHRLELARTCSGSRGAGFKGWQKLSASTIAELDPVDDVLDTGRTWPSGCRGVARPPAETPHRW